MVSPVKGSRGGSLSTSWHTSLSQLAVMSRMSLCLKMGKPPCRQIIAWSVEKGVPHIQCCGVLFSCHPYRKLRNEAGQLHQFLELAELCLQVGVDAAAVLVAGQHLVAERLDHMVGGYADVGGAAGDQVEHRVEHAPLRAPAGVAVRLGVVEAEQLVGAVDQVNTHRARPATPRPARSGCRRTLWGE